MFARSGKILVIVALVLTTGLHWAALQTFAWSAMLANHLRTESVGESVAQTFDGLHPCCLCKAIAAAKQAEKKGEAVAPLLKFEFPLYGETVILTPPARFAQMQFGNSFAASLSSKPPLPPPRNFCS